MTTQSATLSPRREVPSPELVLGVLALLTFLLIPLKVNTIYSGLPAHPLFLHVPVILIPLVGIAALVLVFRPRLFERHGVWVTALSVIALAATHLTMGAGEALRRDLGLGHGDSGAIGAVVGSPRVGDAVLVAQHAAAASKLRLLFILFTAVMLIALTLHRAGRGPGADTITGVAFVDPVLMRVRTVAPVLIATRALLGMLAVGSLYFVFHTGDLGSKAVWKNRVGGGARRFGPPGFGPPGAPRRPGFPGG